MGITKLKVSNFKSFDELEIELRPLNIVVGANAAGKSNFLEIFRFLRDIAQSGLENAVSLQGGIGYLANLKIERSRPISIQVSVAASPSAPLMMLGVVGSELVRARLLKVTYRLDLHLRESRREYGIASEEIRYDVALVGTPSHSAIKGSVRICRLDCRAVPSFHFPEAIWPKNAVPWIAGFFGSDDTLASDESLLQRSERPLLPGIAIFDFDPRLSKRATLITGRAELDPDGSNLAIVLRKILSDNDKAVHFFSLLRDLLPFVEELRVEHLADKSLLFLLRETYSGQTYVPASFLSNGTIHVTALLLALYFDPAGVTLLEEPERSIHPHLVSRVVAMMEDAARARQIVTTTHNPEMVKHAALADLLLVQRDENGFSRLSRPAESAELQVFLENELGVDELYVQNLLGVGHGI